MLSNPAIRRTIEILQHMISLHVTKLIITPTNLMIIVIPIVTIVTMTIIARIAMTTKIGITMVIVHMGTRIIISTIVTMVAMMQIIIIVLRGLI